MSEHQRRRRGHPSTGPWSRGPHPRERIAVAVTGGADRDVAADAARHTTAAVGGGAGEVVWFDEADAQCLAAAGPPTLRRKKNHRNANLMEYRREDGRPVVIAEMSVRWGDLMY